MFGLKSLTVRNEGETEVAAAAVNSFPLSKLYLTIYLTVPGSVQPLKVSTTDWEVIVLIVTFRPDGTVE